MRGKYTLIITLGVLASLFSLPWLGVAHAATSPANSLADQLTNTSGAVLIVWEISRSLVDIVVVIALFAIAFANIFHLNINTYAAKKALPGLVIGVILSNASLLLIRFLVDVCTALSNLAAQIGVNYAGNLGACSTSNPITQLISCYFPYVIGGTIYPAIVTTIIATGGLGLIAFIILVIYYVFIVVAFAWNLLKRLILLYFLIAIAPLAFISYGIPSFQKYFTMWWNNFLRYLFLLPIILFGMSLTVILAFVYFGSITGSGTGGVVAGELGTSAFTTAITGAFTGNWQNLVGLIMVLVAANTVLNLPKIVTKGTVMALDSVDTFKKLAQGLPGTAAWAQGVHGAATTNLQRSRGEKQINAYADQLRARGKSAAQVARAEKYLRQRLDDKIKKTSENRDRRYNTFRGVSHIMANPKVIQDAWQERIDERKKGDVRAANRLAFNPLAGTLPKRNVLETVKGNDAGYRSATTRTADDSKDYISESQYRKDVGGNKLFDAMQAHYKGLASDDDRIKFQDKVIAASKYGDMRAVLDEIGFRDSATLNDMATAREYFRGARKIGNQNRGASSGRKVANQTAAGFFAHGSGEVSEAIEDEVKAVTESLDDKTRAAITDRTQEISEQAKHIQLAPGATREELQGRLTETLNNWQDVLKEGVDSLGPEQMTRVRALRDQTQEILEGSLDQTSTSHQQLQNILQEMNDRDGRITPENAKSLAQMVENHSVALAAGAGVNNGGYNSGNTRQILERSETAKQVISSTADRIAKFDPEQLKAFSDAITNASTGNTQQLEAFLQQHQAAMNKIFGNQDLKAQQRALEDMSSKIRTSLTEAISGRGKRSISSILRGGLEDMHKSLGRHTVDLNIPATGQSEPNIASQPTTGNVPPQANPATPTGSVPSNPAPAASIAQPPPEQTPPPFPPQDPNS